MELDFEIDKLTHSLEDARTGKIFQTEVVPLTKTDLKDITKKVGWKFNWNMEFSTTNRQVFKLVLQQQPVIIQGLVAFTVKSDHLFMDLIETAPHNYGRKKQYQGVLGNLVAHVCKLAFELGFDGEMMFFAKTKLISHYEKELGATSFGQRMVMYKAAATNLVDRYYPGFITNKLS